MTKKNPHGLDNLVVCNLFLSELKPGLITAKRQAKGMSSLEGSFRVSIYVRASTAFQTGFLRSRMLSKPFATLPGALIPHSDDLAKQIHCALSERSQHISTRIFSLN